MSVKRYRTKKKFDLARRKALLRFGSEKVTWYGTWRDYVLIVTSKGRAS